MYTPLKLPKCAGLGHPNSQISRNYAQEIVSEQNE